MPNIHGLHSNERKDDSDNDEETRYVGGADGKEVKEGEKWRDLRR